MINIKTAKFEVKAMDEKLGTFEGYASVFGNRDNGGDVVEKGAFNRSINAKGGRFPILFAHAYKEPPIGIATVKEDDHGLFTQGKLFIHDIVKGDTTIKAMERAKDVYYGLVEKAMDGMSFMYDTIQSKEGNLNGEYVRFLKELKLYEVSVVNFGMNELAGVSWVKGLGLEDNDTNKDLLTRVAVLEKANTEQAGKYKTDLEALHLKFEELAKRTSSDDESAQALKAIQAVTAGIKEDLKSLGV